MPYQIEVLAINIELYKSIKIACDSLNKVQSEFEFRIPSDKLKDKLYSYQRSEYKTTEIYQWINNYNRVGRGIAPPPSHTTVHALAHGGFLKLFNLS